MKIEHLNLEKIIDLDKWQKLQDSIALVTKMAIITVDYKGTPVSNHSNCHPFCSEVRKDPSLSSHCQKCDSRGGIEAARLNSPYIYLCHYNIVDLAIPIIIDNKYIGAIMAGQIKLSNSDEESSLEKILTLNSTTNLEYLDGLYSSLPVLPYKEVINISKMLSNLCDFIVSQTLNKSLLSNLHKDISPSVSNYSYDNIQKLKNELSNAFLNNHIKNSISNIYVPRNKTLVPIFDYIYSHKNEHITLKTASSLCHLSPSYFSKIFTKETGRNFTSYISELKIEWSKIMLESTDTTISQISDDLGFSDSGYFIKIFKKHEGLTPSVYRKHCRDTSLQTI